MKNKTKKKNRAGRFVFSVICLAMIAFFGTGAAIDIVESVQLKAELKAARKELVELKDGKESLVLQQQKLTDPAYVENYARGTHLLSKDDEQVFVLPKGN